MTTPTSSPAQRAVLRAAGLALGVLADAVLRDPANRWHPVAWYGQAVDRVTGPLWDDSRAAGVRFLVVCLTPVAALGVGLEGVRSRPARVLSTAAATWLVLGSASLAREGELMARHLSDGELDAARQRLTHLCGRDPEDLDETELARAAIESLAENCSDAAVASLFWGALLGVPGLLTHRAVNTLDAMVGHHTERWENFGWASARTDDLVNLAPARLTGALACLLAPCVGGRTGTAWRIMRRDGANHPSPNGGHCESAWAGALGVRLGGTNVYYGQRVEHRGLLGEGPRPRGEQLGGAARLVRLVTAGATVAAGLALVAGAGIAARKGSGQ